jgi:hypothetical protein
MTHLGLVEQRLYINSFLSNQNFSDFLNILAHFPLLLSSCHSILTLSLAYTQGCCISQTLNLNQVLAIILNYKKIYEDIMNIDPNIRLVTICDSGGKILHSGHRQGVTNLLTAEESNKSLDLAIKAWKTRSELAPKIGKGKYVLAEYEKIKRITMPLGEDHILYITTEVDADDRGIIDKVRRLSF